jgi:hypothetical protein
VKLNVGPSEHTLQVRLLVYLDEHARRDTYYCFAIPNAGRRSLRMGASMKHEGLKSGVADLCFMLPAGKAAWLELKKPGNYQTLEQKGFQARCERLGHPYAVAKTLEQAIGILRSWDVLR